MCALRLTDIKTMFRSCIGIGKSNLPITYFRRTEFVILFYTVHDDGCILIGTLSSSNIHHERKFAIGSLPDFMYFHILTSDTIYECNKLNVLSPRLQKSLQYTVENVPLERKPIVILRANRFLSTSCWKFQCPRIY